MQDPENRLSEYIDALNAERQPEMDDNDSAELEKLYATVRLVRSLKEPVLPDSRQLAEDVATGVSHSIGTEREIKQKTTRFRRPWFFTPGAAIAAGLLLFLAVAGWAGLFNRDVALAIGKKQ